MEKDSFCRQGGLFNEIELGWGTVFHEGELE